MISSVLVWTVMLRLLPIGQSCSEESLKNDNQTYCDQCPAGYHAIMTDDSNPTQTKARCQRCEEGSTFTAVPNRSPECMTCTTCKNSFKDNQKVSKECVYNRDVECACKEDYYRRENYDGNMYCVHCFDQKPPRDDCQRKECIQHAKYRDHCQPSNQTTAPLIVPSDSRPTDPAQNTTMLVVIVLVVGTMVFLVGIWFRVVARILYRARLSVAREDPESTSLGLKLTAQETLPPSTMTLHVCEDPPAMPFYQGPFAAHPSHHHPLLRPMEAPASGERWPAAVLYALIQEVPLRRWKELLRHLGVAEQQLERVEVEAGAACLGSREKQYQMLRLWTQRPASALPEVYAALHRMELAGCAELLREHLGTLGLGGAE